MVKNKKNAKPSLILLGIVYAVVFSLWLLYRMFFRYPEEIDELVVKPLLWITPVIIVNYQRRFPAINIRLPKNLFHSLIFAAFIGLLLPLILIFPRLISHGVNLQGELNPFIFLIPIGTAISEEYLFRGFFLKHLLSYFPPLISNITVSLFFAAIHLPLILFIYNNDIVIILSRFYLLIISSFLFGFLYIKNKIIVPSVIAHFINNLILAV